MAGWDTPYTYEPNPLFERSFRCLRFCRYKSPHLQTGNKIIMPPSSLRAIVSVDIKFPLTFRIEGPDERISHCGVLEFDADEDCIHVPDWMMRSLKVVEGERVVLRNASLSKACYMQLQPRSTAFVTEVGDHRAVLERTLRDFTCASKGDAIMVEYNGREYYVDVLRVEPGDAASLIDTDCRVDFAAPLDYVEEGGGGGRTDVVSEEVGGGGDCECGEKKELGFAPFTGRGRRLDGKASSVAERMSRMVVEEMEKMVIDEKEGKRKREKDDGNEEEREKFKVFTGRSHVLGGLGF